MLIEKIFRELNTYQVDIEIHIQRSVTNKEMKYRMYNKIIFENKSAYLSWKKLLKYN